MWLCVVGGGGVVGGVGVVCGCGCGCGCVRVVAKVYEWRSAAGCGRVLSPRLEQYPEHGSDIQLELLRCWGSNLWRSIWG